MYLLCLLTYFQGAAASFFSHAIHIIHVPSDANKHVGLNWNRLQTQTCIVNLHCTPFSVKLGLMLGMGMGKGKCKKLFCKSY